MKRTLADIKHALANAPTGVTCLVVGKGVITDAVAMLETQRAEIEFLRRQLGMFPSAAASAQTMI